MTTPVRRRGIRWSVVILGLIALQASTDAMVVVRMESKVDLAIQKYGVTGRGVTVVVIDRGIDWQHPDFIRPDGHTRIRAMLDMTGLSGCGATGAVEYTEAQINAALLGGPPLGERDAVGHGTATTGAAAGNGRASSGLYRGIAPDADLIIVKAVAEAVPAHGSIPASPALNACLTDALDWADQKATELGQPAVGIINSGTQSGPLDGTNYVSRKIDAVFGAHRRGRAYVSASGDEGNAADHAGGSYSSDADTVVRLTSTSVDGGYAQMWYSGSSVAEVTVSFDDGATLGPVWLQTCTNGSGITICQYVPGPVGNFDHLAYILVTGHAGSGTLRLRAHQPSSAGRFDVYGSIFNGYGALLLGFLDHLVPGRLTDYSSTRSAIVTGDYSAGAGLWAGSSGGPTRDGRLGISLTAPGENDVVPLARDSWWSTYFPPNTLYTGFGYTSGAAPIVVGAAALMLQMRPQLTAGEIRQILQQTATADAFTGAVPNGDWGYGKLNVLAALDAVASLPPPPPIRGDFDNDGKADVAVFRPSSGAWFTLRSSSHNTTFGSYNWGLVGDRPEPGDYDGDGKIDLAVYRPGNGSWYILTSSSNFATPLGFSWGIAGDVPVPADYDGDGRTDIAVYRPSTGHWFVLNSRTNFTTWSTYQWGAPTDIPVPGDYDGDGRPDVAVFRPSSGAWLVLNSSTSYTTSSTYFWGVATDVPVPADYDGDGITDIAVFRPATGSWFVLKSNTGFSGWDTHQWGASSDVPVPADYDGDGKADFAVYRSSSSSWFISRSSTNNSTWDTYQWGAAGDAPVVVTP